MDVFRRLLTNVLERLSGVKMLTNRRVKASTKRLLMCQIEKFPDGCNLNKLERLNQHLSHHWKLLLEELVCQGKVIKVHTKYYTDNNAIVNNGRYLSEEMRDYMIEKISQKGTFGISALEIEKELNKRYPVVDSEEVSATLCRKVVDGTLRQKANANFMKRLI
ncbi:hypothetical protein AVEN_82039-1 [Araneus ventricosus]|uniref:Uncharacterized protein n=1 Tax=Araneus ventricosus TaxID=182803 RepID=A0A4Y2KHH6_ARAVE|nr:hypothetical protein AVEN_82039-1 [Araneus ventricosus]